MIKYIKNRSRNSIVYIFGGSLFLVWSFTFKEREKKYTVYIEEYQHYFTPQKTDCIDTLEFKIDNGRTLKIILMDCMGKMRLQCYKNHRKLEEGEYENSLDLLKKYTKSTGAMSGKKFVRVFEYYQPLRTGVWKFYNDQGKLKSTKVYNRGIEQD